MLLMRTIFWDVTPCNSIKIHYHFEGTHRFHRTDSQRKIPGLGRRQDELPADGATAFPSNVYEPPDYNAQEP
jgi:hypothetical protein